MKEHGWLVAIVCFIAIHFFEKWTDSSAAIPRLEAKMAAIEEDVSDIEEKLDRALLATHSTPSSLHLEALLRMKEMRYGQHETQRIPFYGQTRFR